MVTVDQRAARAEELAARIAAAAEPLRFAAGLYRALKRYGVATELVVYPREPHGPREEKHQIDILKRLLAWFGHYLPEPEGI